MNARASSIPSDLEFLAWTLDERYRLPWLNVRFGWDAILGIVPVVGDVATSAVSLYIIARARHLGAPMSLILRMCGNLLLDTVLGSIPLLGSVFDIAFRANTANLRLLREWLEGHRFEHHAVPESTWRLAAGRT